MITTYTRGELVNALRLCSMSSDAELIVHEPTGTRFHFKELRGTTGVKELVLGSNGRALPLRTQERTLSVEEELELREQHTARAIKNINKQPKTLWEPRKQRAAA